MLSSYDDCALRFLCTLCWSCLPWTVDDDGRAFLAQAVRILHYLVVAPVFGPGCDFHVRGGADATRPSPATAILVECGKDDNIISYSIVCKP